MPEFLPLSETPFALPGDRDMLPSERRDYVRTHRTCIYGYARQSDGPAMSVVYYIPTTDDELLISTMAGRAKARAAGRDGKVSLCVLDENWPVGYLQVYCDAVIDTDRDLTIDVMMAVGGRMSGTPLGDDARPFVDLDGTLDLDAIGSGIKDDIHAGHRDRMAQRNHLVCALCRHDPRDSGGLKDIALRQSP